MDRYWERRSMVEAYEFHMPERARMPLVEGTLAGYPGVLWERDTADGPLRPRVQSDLGKLEVFDGDWITRDVKGRYGVVSAAVFTVSYVRATQNLDPRAVGAEGTEAQGPGGGPLLPTPPGGYAGDVLLSARVVHPASAAVLQFFDYAQLPPRLQAVSKPFCELARKIAAELDGPELTVALRKLLEAKDCAVRAAVSTPVPR